MTATVLVHLSLLLCVSMCKEIIQSARFYIVLHAFLEEIVDDMTVKLHVCTPKYMIDFDVHVYVQYMHTCT